MADLSEIQASQSVKIAGSSPSGVESTWVNATPNGDMTVTDTIKAGGIEGALTVGTSAVEVKVGGSALANRKIVTLYNNSSAILYWGYTSGVTTSSGTPIQKSELMRWAASDACSIWVIAGSAGNNARITESP